VHKKGTGGSSRQGPPFICGKDLVKVSLSKRQNIHRTKVLIYGTLVKLFFITGKKVGQMRLGERYLDFRPMGIRGFHLTSHYRRLYSNIEGYGMKVSITSNHTSRNGAYRSYRQVHLTVAPYSVFIRRVYLFLMMLCIGRSKPMKVIYDKGISIEK